MMDVMNADIGGEPAQEGRQGIVGAAVQRNLLQIPRLVVGPDRMFKLMLDVEQPDADQPYHRGNDTADRGIGRHGAEPWLPTLTHQADRQAVLHDEQVSRAYAEHDEGVPVEPVTQAP